MSVDHKKALYGAARAQRIAKITNDALNECRELLKARGNVWTTITTESGEAMDAYLPPNDIIVRKLKAAVAEIKRLEAGRP